MAGPVLRPQGLLIDLDGTVYEGDRPVPGAADAVAALRSARLPLRFVTNTTRRPRRAIIERLGAMGIDCRPDEVFTAPLAAAGWLEERGLARVFLCLPEPTREDLAGFEPTERDPDAVVVGDLGNAWTFDLLNRAFRALLEGAELLAIQKNRYWKTADGLILDAGAFVAALEYAADVRATVVGKPSPTFFRVAARSMGLELGAVAMVGDDLEGDVGGARAAGASGILVRTGKYRAGALEGSAVQPDSVVDSLASLPGLLFS